jgi:hypothetical protein
VTSLARPNLSGSQAAPDARADGPGPATRSVALVAVLAGTLRPTAWDRSISRSILDLPVDARTTVLNRWRRHTADAARSLGFAVPSLHVLLTRGSTPPAVTDAPDLCNASIKVDQAEFPGTGGALRHAALGLPDDARVLVVSGQQVPLRPLDELLARLFDTGGDLAMCATDDGLPVGLMLTSARLLGAIRETAFSDFKEQALPELAKRFDIRVLHSPRTFAAPIRTMDGYLAALRALAKGDRQVSLSPWTEDWSSSFSVVEPGATVDPSARLHDSVILRGAVVAPGALVVRSVVCPGARVNANDRLVDTLLSARGAKATTGSQT